MVNYDIERAVSVTTYSDESSQHDHPRTESKLTIAKAGKRDEGNYTCSPSNAEKATVVIFVTRGKSILLMLNCFYLILSTMVRGSLSL